LSFQGSAHLIGVGSLSNLRLQIYESKVTEEQKERLLQLKKQGKTVEAVKVFRENTKLELLDASWYLEKL